MFVRRMSAGLDITDEEIDAVGSEEAERRWKVAYDAAWAAYVDHIRSRDFSTAGDLLPFFLTDFFHDAALEDFRIDGDDRTVGFTCDALWIERNDETVDAVFDIIFDEVVWLEVALDVPTGNYADYRYSEIDGLDERIQAADQKFEASHHSIVIETGWGGHVSIVFQRVRVSPRDPASWLQLLRDSDVRTPGLFTGFSETVAGTTSA